MNLHGRARLNRGLKLVSRAYLDKAVSKVVARLSPEWKQILVQSLERHGQSHDFDLAVDSWRTRGVVNTVFTLSGSETVLIEAIGDSLPAEIHSWPPLKARLLHQATLDVDSGLVFVDDRVAQQSGSPIRSARDSSFITGATLRLDGPSTSLNDQIVAPLGDTWHYYHFLAETLPLALQTRQVRPDVVFVTSSVPSSWATEALSSLNLRILVMDTGTVLRNQKVVLGDKPHPFWPRPKDLSILRTAALEAAGNLRRPHSVLFSSRFGASREVPGIDGLTRTLDTHGVEKSLFSELTWIEQVRSVAGASALVGLHGAGLANLAFMQPGSAVVELSSGDWFTSCYRRMSAILDLDYRFVSLASSEDHPDGVITEQTSEQVLGILHEKNLLA